MTTNHTDIAPAADQGPEFFPHHVEAARYLTRDIPGIGGVIKQRPEDFYVEEIPLYHPVGEGEHIYLFVEKRGMPAIEMLSVLARHFGVPRGAVGHAGMKDKFAVTRQVVSIHTPGRSAEDFPSLDHPDISILWADQHTNKLKRGHLAGNRFSIRAREVRPQDVLHARQSIDRLAEEGVPNRFGVQRFGYLANNHVVGREILLNRPQRVLDLMLMPNDRAPVTQTEARRLYASGDYKGAYQAWPRNYRAESLALRALAKTGEPAKAVRAIDPTAASYLVSAFQSAVFNDVLNRRVLAGTLAQLVPGDLAHIAKRKTVFAITADNADEDDIRRRLRDFEIAPSGPMWGSDMPRAAGQAERDELGALAGAGMSPEDLMGTPAIPNLEMVRGERRPLRIRLTDPEVEGGVDEHGPYIRCAFDLPKGAFATTVMDEIMKTTTAGIDDDGE